MTKTNLFLVCLGLGLAAVACAPPEGPAAPSYETDVKPIMMAHCVRCHGQGDKLNVDPGLVGTELAGMAPAAVYLDHYEDRMPCGTGTCSGAKTAVTFLRSGLYLRGSGKDRMPPKPSDPLSDHEIGIIERWVAEMPTPKP